MLKGYSMLCEVDPLSRGRDLDVSILQLPLDRGEPL